MGCYNTSFKSFVASMYLSISSKSFLGVTFAYARITNKKIEHDMEKLADKFDKFNDTMGL